MVLLQVTLYQICYNEVMKRKLTIGIVLVLLTVGGFILYSSSKTSYSSSSGATKSNLQPKLTRAEVAKHSSASNCWVVIHGVVYDATKYASVHPGGKNVLSTCGSDATAIFESSTTSDSPNGSTLKLSSSEANAQIGQFLLGQLKD